MRKIMMNDGEMYSGSNVEILLHMKSRAWGSENDSLSEYITSMTARLEELTGIRIELDLTQKDEENMAREFLDRIVTEGLATDR